MLRRATDAVAPPNTCRLVNGTVAVPALRKRDFKL
jgi:hypothetical protein